MTGDLKKRDKGRDRYQEETHIEQRKGESGKGREKGKHIQKLRASRRGAWY